MSNRIESVLTNRIQNAHNDFRTADAGPGSFVALPMPATSAAQLARTQRLYQRALEEARRVVQPSWLERDVLGVWN